MRSDKKFIVKVVYGREYATTLSMMRNLASTLQRSYDIPIISLSNREYWFETPNCIVKYFDKPERLHGIRADEVFGCDPETRAYHRKPSNKLPYEGGILNYILEVEKGAAVEE